MNTKDILDHYYKIYHTEDFVTNDPVQFPRRYSLLQDIEIVSLLSATIAWGKRSMILRSCERLFSEMGTSPYDYVMNSGDKLFDEKKNIHRTFFGRDLRRMCNGLRHIYEHNESLEELFIGKDMWQGIDALKGSISIANGEEYKSFGSSACKRHHLMLRWLCRQNSPVDMGVWKRVPSSELQIPLDVHVGRVAEGLGLLTRKTKDRKAVEEITRKLKLICPEDPVKYDYALFGYGEDNYNTTSKK